jgi:threonylcarbamoyladenosine tRNA methylthiotransferase MtaB
VHLGAYGRDLIPRRSFEELLHAASRTSSDVLLRLGSLEPMDCTPGVIRILAGTSKFAPSLHLPMQHASSTMLRLMRRPYTPDYYAGLVAEIRRELPDAAIGSDIIVGFPGETERDFEELQSYLENSPLTHLHVFPYSDRPGTEASGLKGRVDGAVVRARARCICETGRRLSGRFMRRQNGRIARALVLDDGMCAVTRNGLKVRLTAPRARNEYVIVRLRLTSETLTGQLLTDPASL